jgi:hypothetical protein
MVSRTGHTQSRIPIPHWEKSIVLRVAHDHKRLPFPSLPEESFGGYTRGFSIANVDIYMGILDFRGVT